MERTISDIERRLNPPPLAFQLVTEAVYQEYRRNRPIGPATLKEIESINRGNSATLLLPSSRLVIIPSDTPEKTAQKLFSALVQAHERFSFEGRNQDLSEKWKATPVFFGGFLEHEGDIKSLNEQINSILSEFEIL